MDTAVHEGESETGEAVLRPLAALGACGAGPDRRRRPSTARSRITDAQQVLRQLRLNAGNHACVTKP